MQNIKSKLKIKNHLLIFLFCLLGIFFLLKECRAFTNVEVVNYQAPAEIFYRQTFDNLVLDVKIPSGVVEGEDVLEAIAFRSQGTVFDGTDFTDFVLWADNVAEPGFQGLGVDKKLGKLRFNPNNSSWYLTDLSELVPEHGLRIFVSVEVPSYATVNRFFKMELAALLDTYNNCQYDFGDLGVFLRSCNNGPTDSAVVNQYIQTINSWAVDELAPKTAITEPVQNQTIATTTYVISGLARDQGNSVIKLVEVGIINKANPQEVNWQTAEISQSTGLEKQWQYVWQNIEQGEYVLKIRASDTNFGQGQSEREINVTVTLETAEEPEELEDLENNIEEPTEEQLEEEQIGEPEAVKTKEEQIADLQEQIQQIQQQLIILISQLIALLQTSL